MSADSHIAAIRTVRKERQSAIGVRPPTMALTIPMGQFSAVGVGQA
jgi:hypothetical protein